MSFGIFQTDFPASSPQFYQAGTHDPSVIASYGVQGTLFIRVGALGGAIYSKLDAGTTTNWQINSFGAPISMSNLGVPVVGVVANINTQNVRVQSSGVGGLGQIFYKDSSVILAGPPNTVIYAPNVNTDWIILVNSVGTVINLPTLGAGVKQSFLIKDITGNPNPNIQVNATGGNLVEGGGVGFTMNTPYRSSYQHFAGAGSWFELGLT